MNHTFDVGLVYSQTKCDSGYANSSLPTQELSRKKIT
jgi:hypothetical protein